MSEQEKDVFKEIFVQLGSGSTVGFEFRIPNAIVKHYSIGPEDGVRCVLKEILNEHMKDAKKIDKEILIDVNSSRAKGCIPKGISDLYGIKDNNYVRLSIEEIIH